MSDDAGREFMAATAEYEAALMSGDEVRIATADERLTAADRFYGAELAERVRRHRVRTSLPTFEEMLAHQWSQPARGVRPMTTFDDPFTMELDLCTPPSHFHGYQFTCSSKAESPATWPCTGSAHHGGEHIRCVCSCHGATPPTAISVNVARRDAGCECDLKTLDAFGCTDGCGCYKCRLEVDNARLREALRPFTRCPRFGHTDDTRRRRVDCSDDQCMNPEHTRYVECDHPSHAAMEALVDG